MELVATYAALVLSIVLAIDRAVARAKNETKDQLKEARAQIDALRSFRDRIEGANAVDRLTKVEELQRADENALIRIEEKLQATEVILTTLTDELRALGRQDAPG